MFILLTNYLSHTKNHPLPLREGAKRKEPKHRFGPLSGHTGKCALDFEWSRMRSDKEGEGIQ